MKKQRLIHFWLFSVLLMLPALMTIGQNGTAYQMKITGVAQVSCNVYEMDVTMNSTVPSNLVRLANFQCGILVNPAIVPAGASIEIALVPNSSTIPVVSMRPGPEKFLYNNNTNCIQVAPVVPPGTANSFNVSMTGIKLFRVRVACSQPFLTGENTNHTWNFDLATAYPTKVFGYISGVNTDITAQASHLKVTPADVVLAGGFPDPIAQTVTSDVTEFCNVPGAGATISLGSTQVGYTYYLYSDGVRVPGQNGIIYGNGSSQSFGALASGSIMSVTSVGCVGEIPMLNTIALTPIPPVSVSVSIDASPGTTVAPGTLVTFTATPVNGGDFPFTIWSVNGVPDYNTFDPVYYYTPVNGDQIFCEFYPSSEICTEDMVATSNVLIMTVQTLPQEFSVTGGGTICQGAQAFVFLSGSETDFSYQLLKDGQPYGLPVQGTGLPLEWTVTEAGIYEVVSGPVMMAGFVEVIVIPTTTNTTVVTECDSYTWPYNSQTYTVSGIYEVVTGCHTEILDLTIIPSSTNTTVLTECDSYFWAVSGQTYTMSGIYTEVVGCVTEVLDLTIIPSTSNTTTLTVCDSYTWAENGMTYTASGIYTVVTGCHTEILDLTVIPSTTVDIYITACDEYYWGLTGMTYTVSGDYTYVDGCETTILHLTINPSIEYNYFATSCDEYYWDISDMTYTASGDYTYVDNCITYILHLTIIPTTTVDIYMTSCDEYYWGLTDMTYTVSGDYSFVDGCEITILHLTIIPSTTVDIYMTACDSYLWDLTGMLYTVSGDYSYVDGCETTILHLTVIPSTTVDVYETACDSYYWTLTDMTYNASGDYYYVDGCETTVLHLSIITSTSETLYMTTCDEYEWFMDGVTYTQTGIYTYVVGCHTFILDLTIIPSTSNTTVVSECDSYTWPYNGLTYTMSGVYVEVDGCHTETLDLTVIPSTSYTTEMSACDSFTWSENGMTYTASGVYTVVTGCHTEILDLTIIPSTTNTTVVSECDSYTWPYNGQTYTMSGVYVEVDGCHTEILDLIVVPSTSYTTEMSACDSFTWSENGMTYTASGIYSVVTGCHTEILDLTIIPSTTNTTVVSECDSYTWPYNGQTYTMSGVYVEIDGCHTEILDLIVIPSTSNTTTLTVCDSYTWAENGMTYTASGIYSVVTGCHTEILDLTVIPSTTNTTVLSECDSYFWAENGMTYTTSGVYTVVTGCHTEILNLTINPTYYFVENVSVYDNQLPFVWSVNNAEYFVSGQYFANYLTIFGCDSIYELNLTVKPAEPLKVTKNIGTAVQANWDAIPGASLYQLRYRELPLGTWMYVTQSTQLFRKIAGLTPGTQYELQIRHKVGYIWEDWNTAYAPIIFTTNVINFSATYDIGTKFLLEWTELDDISSYILQYRMAGSPTWMTKGFFTTNSAVIGSVLENGTYEFRICPRYSEISFEWSQIGSITTTYIVINVDNYDGMYADFSWAPVMNPAADAYFLQTRQVGMTTVNSYYTTTNSRSVTNMIAGVAYEYRLVVRYDGVSWGATSWRPLVAGSKEESTVIQPMNDLNVYPNPVSDILTVEIMSTADATHVWSLYDVNGKLIMSGTGSLTSGLNYMQIETGQLPTGLYMLQSNFNGMMRTSRIIKQ